MGENSTLLITDKVLLVLSTDGILRVQPLAAEAFEPIQSYEVAESATWAMPAVHGNSLFIKDKTNLLRLDF